MDKNILLIDKPKDWTSFDVVAKIRNELRRKQKDEREPREIPGLRPGMTKKKIKVGHAGTLDPFATGLLIVLLSEATKKQDEFMKKDKEYEATLKLGFTSTTGDPEGEITPFHRHPDDRKDPGLDSSLGAQNDENKEDCRVVNSELTPRNDIPAVEAIETALEAFKGEITQTPPIYSAIKVNGKRAYQLARQGQKVEIKSRNVVIYELQLLNYSYPELKIRVKCSSGTYIRTLAEDIGKKLGCGAYLTELRRTKIGEYDIKEALSIEEALKVIDLEK